MARKFDIIERLKAKNERPFVMIDEEHKFTINTSKTNVMAILAVTGDEKKETTVKEDIEMIDKIISIALGDKALEYIKELDLTMAAYSLIIDAIMAGINDKDIDELDKEEKK